MIFETNWLARLLFVALAIATSNLQTLAADNNKLTAEDIANKWEARKDGTLTDAEFVKLVRGHYQFDPSGENSLKNLKDKNNSPRVKPEEIDTMKKLLSAMEDNFSLFQIMAGVKLENPYTIEITPAVPASGTTPGTAASATLKPNNSKTDGFFELPSQLDTSIGRESSWILSKSQRQRERGTRANRTKLLGEPLLRHLHLKWTFLSVT